MLLLRTGTFFAVAFAIGTSQIALAQRAQVTGIVRNDRGELLGNARIHATSVGVDTTVLTNDRGQYSLLLPMGTARVTVTAFGYERFDAEIPVENAVTKADFQLRGLARQIPAFAVRERWMGMRGVIGDEVTREPIAGAEVMMAQARTKLFTDNLGRFEIPLISENQTVVQVKRDGYQTRVTSFGVTEGQATDVVIFLKPGNDIKGMSYTLRDLPQRLTLVPFRSFVANHEQLSKNGAVTVIPSAPPNRYSVQRCPGSKKSVMWNTSRCGRENERRCTSYLAGKPSFG